MTSCPPNSPEAAFSLVELLAVAAKTPFRRSQPLENMKAITVSGNDTKLSYENQAPHSSLRFLRRRVAGAEASDSAFSLVEVTLALGLMSFAVVAILGLLPTGLNTLRQSMNQTVEAQIVRSLGAQAVISGFTNLAANALYFDDEGLPAESDQSYYTVAVTTNVPAYPGSGNGSNIANSLTTLKITMVAKPNPSAVGKTNYYTLQVANSGK